MLSHRDTILPARRSRRRAASGLALFLFLLMFISASVGSVTAASPTTSGWWWKPQGAAGGILIPNPPSVPADGLAVGGAPDGPTAVAAIRYALLTGESPIKLTLVTSGETGGEVAGINACPAGGPWQAAQGGDWDNRPESACGFATSKGVRSTDGKTWTFNISGFPPTVPGFLDIVLLPAKVPTPAGEVMPGFQIAFNKPDAATLSTIQPVESSTSTYESLGDSSFASVPPDTFATAPLSEPAPAPPEIAEAPAPIAPSVRQLSSPGSRPVDNIPTASRLLFPIVFIAATLHFGYAYMRSRQATRVIA